MSTRAPVTSRAIFGRIPKDDTSMDRLLKDYDASLQHNAVSVASPSLSVASDDTASIKSDHPAVGTGATKPTSKSGEIVDGDETDVDRQKRIRRTVKDTVHAKCSAYSQVLLEPYTTSNVHVTAYYAESGVNFIGPIVTPECIIMCDATNGPSSVALGTCTEFTRIFITDITPRDKLYCGVRVMLSESATNSKHHFLTIQGYANKSHMSPIVTSPGSTLSINARGGNVVYQMVNDVYRLVSVNDSDFNDHKLELELNKVGLSYHAYYNPGALFC